MSPPAQSSPDTQATENITNINASLERRMRRLFRKQYFSEIIHTLSPLAGTPEMTPYLSRLFQRATFAEEQNKKTSKEIPHKEKNRKTLFFGSKKAKREEATKKAVSLLKKELSILEEKKKLDTLEKTGTILKDPETIEKKQKTIEKTTQEIELEIASNFQKNLLPEVKSDGLTGLDLGVKTVNCSELSGDVYDFLDTKKDTSYFYIGDATGHGAAAGLIMTMVNTIMFSLAERITDGISKMLVTLNTEIKPKLTSNMFMTMVLFSWDQKRKKMKYAGAGHEHILIYRASSKEIQRIQTGGIAIGMLPDISSIIKEQEVELSHNDIMVVFTDGITEAKNQEHQKEIFSLEALEQTIIKFAQENISAQKIADNVIQEVRTFQGDKELTDDITIIVTKRIVKEGEKKEIEEYEKKILVENLRKERAELQLKKGDISPDFTLKEENVIKNTLQYIEILLAQKEFLAAKEEIKNILKIRPDLKEANELFETISILEYEHKQSLSFFGNLWFKIKRFFSHAPNTKAYNTKQLIASREKETRELFKRGAYEQALQVIESLEKMNAKKKGSQKLKEKIYQKIGKKTSTQNVLDSLFSETSHPSEVVSLLKGETNISTEKEPQKNVSQPSTNSTQPMIEFHQPNNSDPGTPTEKKKISFPKTNELTDKEKSDSIKGLFDNEDREKKSFKKFMALLSPMSRKDFIFFVNRLSTFLDSGISLRQAIRIIQEQTTHDGLIFTLQKMLDGLEEGEMLSDIMAQNKHIFSEIHIALFRAGEQSGALAEILQSLGKQLSEQDAILKKIKTAMMYPAFVITMSIVMMGGILTFIVPKLTKVYDDTGVAVPKITQIIVGISDYIRDEYIFILLCFFFSLIPLFFFGKTKTGRDIYDWIFLRLPVMGNVIKKTNITLFSSNLSLLLQHDIQVGEALNISSNITTNVYYKKEIIRMRDEMIEKGIMISEAMGLRRGSFKFKNKYFPLELAQTAEVGERSGNIAVIFGRFGTRSAEELQTMIKGMSDLLEPIMLVIVGLSVAVILAAVMMPLTNIGSVIRKQS